MRTNPKLTRSQVYLVPRLTPPFLSFFLVRDTQTMLQLNAWRQPETQRIAGLHVICKASRSLSFVRRLFSSLHEIRLDEFSRWFRDSNSQFFIIFSRVLFSLSFSHYEKRDFYSNSSSSRAPCSCECESDG